MNGKEIISDTKHRTACEKIDDYRTVYRLSVEDNSLSDEGEYKIVAENNVGKSDATATLKLYSTFTSGSLFIRLKNYFSY